MAVSFGILGILIMLDVCFLINYLVIRSLRTLTDRAAKRSAHHSTVKDSSCEENNHINAPALSSTQSASNDKRSMEDLTFAWCLGSVRLEPLRVQKFAGWKPLPGQIGIWTTCFLVILGSILLSPELMVDEIGVSSGSLDSGLCAFEDFDQGLDELRSRLEQLTNLSVAQEQHRLVVDFSLALVNDTALYGVSPYNCPRRGKVSGHKKDWELPSPFFPGYCEKALEAAIEAAQHRECTQQVCDCPVMPDSVIFKVAGLANEKYCGEVCIDVPVPCPQHVAEGAMVETLKDYRYQQYEAAERRRLQQQHKYQFPTSAVDIIKSQATETVDKILHQVNIASYGYVAYSCLATFFPTPIHLFRAPYWVSIKQLFFGVQKPYFILSVVAAWWGVEYFRELWSSPDIQLYLNNLRVGDPCFVNTDYLLERQKILNEFCESLVPLESQWNSSALTALDVLQEVEHFVDDCDCPFPNQYVSEWRESASTQNATMFGFAEMNLCNREDEFVDFSHCTLLTLNEPDLVYLGNSSICTNKTAALQLLLEAPAPEHGERDWYELWIASGFLALLVIKIAVANFGLALMTLADPFVVCGGEFLGFPWTTEAGDSGDAMATVVVSKRRSLQVAALSKTVFWGFVMHACLFNMFAAVYEGVGEETKVEESMTERDKNVLKGCLGFTAMVAAFGLVIVGRFKKSSRKLKRKRQSSEVEATDGDDDDDDIPGFSVGDASSNENHPNDDTSIHS